MIAYSYGFHSPPPPSPLSAVSLNVTTVTKFGNKSINLNRNTLNENKRNENQSHKIN